MRVYARITALERRMKGQVENGCGDYGGPWGSALCPRMPIGMVECAANEAPPDPAPCVHCGRPGLLVVVTRPEAV